MQARGTGNELQKQVDNVYRDAQTQLKSKRIAELSVSDKQQLLKVLQQ